MAVQANRRASVAGLTLTEGNSVGELFSGEGGAALNAAGSHFTVVASVIRDSVVGFVRFGGGLRTRDDATLVLRGSTLTGNRGIGAIANGSRSAAVLADSTISGNSANNAGAVYVTSASAQLINMTITANQESFGGVETDVPQLSLRNSLIAGNSNTDTTGPMRSYGYNLIRQPRRRDRIHSARRSGGQWGHAAGRQLSPLAIHSGQVPTQIPLGGSPALDKGFRFGAGDQRGLPGAFDIGTIAAATNGNNADIGATEAQAIFFSNLNDNGAGSLRQAMLDANANGAGTDDVLFDPSVLGTISLNSKLPLPTGNLNLDGPGANLLTIRRAAAAPAFGLLDISSRCRSASHA